MRKEENRVCQDRRLKKRKKEGCCCKEKIDN